ncbi:hypothetical protein AAG565_13640 [Fontimonas sp. SYSU GA230001]|uniref:hypothetical protein n=1 Tax=Fontimonas sp. SYSU GA230001 TaxID=3142450 RepID=UPI0032B3420F
MKQVGMAVWAAALAAPFAAQAANVDHIDAYYIPDSKLEVRDPGLADAVESDSGDGFGVRLSLSLTDSIFFAAEYQATEHDFDIGGTTVQGTVDISRAGFGYNTTLPVYLLVEYLQADYGFSSGGNDISVDQAGFGAHLGLRFDVIEFLTLEARGGYLHLGDYTGFEYLGGVALNLDRGFSLYADYHVIDIENSDDRGFKTSDLRTGLRFNF